MSHTDTTFAEATPVAARISLRQTLGAAYRILAAYALPFGGIILALASVGEGCSYLAKRLIDEQAPQMQATLINGGGELLGAVLTEIMSVIVGVVWLRIILLGEPHHGRAYLRFGGREFRYLGLDILFGIVVSTPFVIAGGIGMYAALPYVRGDMAWLDSYVLPLTAGAAVWSAVCAAWLGLAYPAVATDATGNSVRHSLRLSRGQRLPLFLAFLLGTFIWDAAPLTLFYAMPAQAADSRIVPFLTTALSFLPRICFVAVSAAAYGRLQHRSLASVAAAFD